MSSGENNKTNQPNSLPAVTSSSLRKLGNQVQVLDDVLKERDRNYWFELALQSKIAKNWSKCKFYSSKSITLDSNFTKPYVLRAYASLKLFLKIEYYSNDIVSFFINEYVFNRLNANDVINPDEWRELHKSLAHAKENFTDEVLFAKHIAEYFADDTKLINYDLVLNEFPSKYLKWGYLLSGLISKRFNELNQMQYYDAAIRIDSKFSPGYYERAVNYEGKNSRKRDKLISDYHKLLELEPKHKQMLSLVIAENLCKQTFDYYGVYDFMIIHLECLINNNHRLNEEETLRICKCVGDDLYIKEPKSALRAFELMKNLGVKLDDRLFYVRGLQKSASGFFHEAIKDFDESIRIDSSESANVFYCRGLAKKEIGDYHGAIEDFTLAFDFSDDEDERNLSIYERAVVKKLIGDLSGALEDIYEALKYWDDNDEYINLKEDLISAISNIRK